jgi:hypothetical protein
MDSTIMSQQRCAVSGRIGPHYPFRFCAKPPTPYVHVRTCICLLLALLDFLTLEPHFYLLPMLPLHSGFGYPDVRNMEAYVKMHFFT